VPAALSHQSLMEFLRSTGVRIGGDGSGAMAFSLVGISAIAFGMESFVSDDFTANTSSCFFWSAAQTESALSPIPFPSRVRGLWPSGCRLRR